MENLKLVNYGGEAEKSLQDLYRSCNLLSMNLPDRLVRDYILQTNLNGIQKVLKSKSKNYDLYTIIVPKDG